MKKSDELRIRTRKLIAKNLIILVALAVVAFVGAYSWFSSTRTATAGSISATNDACDSLEYYIVSPSANDEYSNIKARLAANATYNQQNPTAVQKNTEWHTGAMTLDFTDPEFKFMEDLFLCEVTSDGKTFNIPKIKQYQKVAYVDTSEAFSEAVANQDYLSYDIYFRSQRQYDIVLREDSKIEPLNKNNIAGQNRLDTDDANNESLVKPAAIGAVRMSVMNSSTRELLWIPGPNVWFDNERYLYTGLTSGTGTYGYSGKGTKYYDENNDEFDLTDEGTNNHAYFKQTGNNRSRETINAGDPDEEGNIIASNGNYLLGQNITVVTLNNYDSTDDMYYGHIRINLWIEGEDSEARLAFVNGKFNMYLDFDIIEHQS